VGKADIGKTAPDFTLEGTDGSFTLSKQRGRRVVLLFYPGDNTPVCTKQFCSYAERSDDVSALDAVVVGISDQGLDSHQEFAQKNGIPVPLLADSGRAVAKQYGVSAPVIGTRRAAIIVDEEGIVRHRHVHALGLDYQDVDELAAALRSF
jgi:peroxiredoxin Q/BCP